MASMLSAKTICEAGLVRPLRFRYLWLFIGLGLVGLVLYSTLMPASSIPVVGVNDKAAHAIAFVVLMAWFCGVFEMRYAPLLAISLFCLGILIEMMQQQLSYRSAEFADGLADVAGIGMGWALAATGLKRWAVWVESWVVPERR